MNHVVSCDPCQVNGRSQQKEPIIPFEVPNRPWQRVGIDLVHHNKGWYVIVADYYSKYSWIQALPATAYKDVISALRSCFAEYGIPEDVVSDNGSQFTSQENQLFAALYGFKLTTSSPHYPRGHGFVKSQVQTIKKVLIKCIQDGSDPFLALLQLRITPIDSRTPSLIELLQNSKLHTTLPVSIRPLPSSEAIRASLQAMQRS